MHVPAFCGRHAATGRAWWVVFAPPPMRACREPGSRRRLAPVCGLCHVRTRLLLTRGKRGMPMNVRKPWSLRLLVAAAIALAALSANAQTPARPNIVAIMGDDIGIWNIGAYH